MPAIQWMRTQLPELGSIPQVTKDVMSLAGPVYYP